ncbi:MAG: tRNA (adenosine(37)-N6)-threonylcarbamoyltransferase complex dimerization subunit type 1 TsaB [Bacilli bacterium]
MYKLLLDSSLDFLSIGICKDDIIIDTISYEAWQKQSELMVFELDNILKRNQISCDEIDCIAVTIGPGSYTGIRIALTIAKIFSLAKNIPLIPISSLQALSKKDTYSITLINARSNRSYFAVYYNETKIEEDKVMKNEDVLTYINNHKNYTICGDTKYLNIESEHVDILNEMNRISTYVHSVDNPDLVKPVYLKD